MTQPLTHGVANTASASWPTVPIFDPPMCCPTGLCSPSVDQTLLDVSDLVLTLQAGEVPGLEMLSALGEHILGAPLRVEGR